MLIEKKVTHNRNNFKKSLTEVDITLNCRLSTQESFPFTYCNKTQESSGAVMYANVKAYIPNY